jgi:hypothetical protein
VTSAIGLYTEPLVGATVRQQTHLTEEEIVGKLIRAPKPIFVDQANYLDENSLGTLCFIWERQRLPMVLSGYDDPAATGTEATKREETGGWKRKNAGPGQDGRQPPDDLRSDFGK